MSEMSEKLNNILTAISDFFSTSDSNILTAQILLTILVVLIWIGIFLISKVTKKDFLIKTLITWGIFLFVIGHIKILNQLIRLKSVQFLSFIFFYFAFISILNNGLKKLWDTLWRIHDDVKVKIGTLGFFLSGALLPRTTIQIVYCIYQTFFYLFIEIPGDVMRKFNYSSSFDMIDDSFFGELCYDTLQNLENITDFIKYRLIENEFFSTFVLYWFFISIILWYIYDRLLNNLNITIKNFIIDGKKSIKEFFNTLIIIPSSIKRTLVLSLVMVLGFYFSLSAIVSIPLLQELTETINDAQLKQEIEKQAQSRKVSKQDFDQKYSGILDVYDGDPLIELRSFLGKIEISDKVNQNIGSSAEQIATIAKDNQNDMEWTIVPQDEDLAKIRKKILGEAKKVLKNYEDYYAQLKKNWQDYMLNSYSYQDELPNRVSMQFSLQLYQGLGYIRKTDYMNKLLVWQNTKIAELERNLITARNNFDSSLSNMRQWSQKTSNFIEGFLVEISKLDKNIFQIKNELDSKKRLLEEKIKEQETTTLDEDRKIRYLSELDVLRNDINILEIRLKNNQDDIERILSTAYIEYQDIDNTEKFTNETLFSFFAQPSITDIPAVQPIGFGLGVFSYFANWLLMTRSRDLIIVVGMLGFGILGSAISSFVRNFKIKDDKEFLFTALITIITRGFSAAIVLFLAVEGGISIVASDQVNLNSYVLFFTCFVGAVFSEDAWRWARKQFNENFKTSSIEKRLSTIDGDVKKQDEQTKT